MEERVVFHFFAFQKVQRFSIQIAHDELVDDCVHTTIVFRHGSLGCFMHAPGKRKETKDCALLTTTTNFSSAASLSLTLGPWELYVSQLPLHGVPSSIDEGSKTMVVVKAYHWHCLFEVTKRKL